MNHLPLSGRTAVSVGVAGLMGLHGFKKKSLSLSGAVGACVVVRWSPSQPHVPGDPGATRSTAVTGRRSDLIDPRSQGSIHMVAGGRFGATLIGFYLSGSKLTKYRADVKNKLEADYKEGGQRTIVQAGLDITAPAAPAAEALP